MSETNHDFKKCYDGLSVAYYDFKHHQAYFYVEKGPCKKMDRQPGAIGSNIEPNSLGHYTLHLKVPRKLICYHYDKQCLNREATCFFPLSIKKYCYRIDYFSRNESFGEIREFEWIKSLLVTNNYSKIKFVYHKPHPMYVN